MTDQNAKDRQEWLKSMQEPGESKWWWAIGVAVLMTLFMLVFSVGPVVFPAG